jgi:glycerol dehydrogenase
MSSDSPLDYSPLDPFAGPPLTSGGVPRIFGSPGRYVQGDGVLERAGRYLRRLGLSRPAVLCSQRCLNAEGGALFSSLQDAGMEARHLRFGGECSLLEIGGHVSKLMDSAGSVDCIVAMGGGKVVDAGRAIAHRLGLPTVAVPTLASNDAPCAGVSVIYTPDGVTEDAEIYDENPVLVLVDTGVVARAEERYLVAGIGDAMATWYEARSCSLNDAGVNVFGGRPTLASTALAKLSADTLYEYGVAAVEAVRSSTVDAALEHVVEANTLLSGLGYESGGLAIAHAMAQGYTVVESVHQTALHGEMVAMGVLAQLVLEQWWEEAERAARFFVAVGLPVRLEQIGLSADAKEDLGRVIDAALAFPFITNFPGEVNQDNLMAAVLEADELGRSVMEMSPPGEP